LDDLTQSFGMWLYQYGPSDETTTQFLVTVIGTGIVILLFEFLRPYFRVLNEKRYKKYKSKLEENEKFIRALPSLRWPPQNDEQRKWWNTAFKKLGKFSLVVVIFCLIVGGLWFWKDEYIDRSVSDSRTSVMKSMKGSIEDFDNQAKRLWQKATLDSMSENSCEKENMEMRKLQTSIICRERAGLLTNQHDDEFVRHYRLCMIDNGWQTKQCTCDEKNDECIPLFKNSSTCELVRWKADGIYLGVECTGYTQRKYRLESDQKTCNETASIVEAEKQEIAMKKSYNGVYEMYMYNSIPELDRLSRTIATYRMCMRHKGWNIQDCPEDEIGSIKCRKIWFSESTCQRLTRNWLEGKTAKHACLDVRHWINRSSKQ